MGYKLTYELQGKGSSPKITIRLTDMQFKRIKNIARKRNETKSEVIRKAIDLFLNHRKNFRS